MDNTVENLNYCFYIALDSKFEGIIRNRTV